jgi:prephenate dehydrogenase
MNLAIIGIGLIGGSLAITLKENGYARRIIGVDVEPDNIDKALRRRLIDEGMELSEALAASDLIVLATPVDAMLQLLPNVLDRIGARQVVIDVGSTKEKLLQAVQDHPRRGRLVACHPMAGTEHSGPEAALPNLFDHQTVVFCEPERSDPDALAEVQALFDSIPMRPVSLGAKEHDLHTAYVSHISHISSFALALTVLEKEKDEDRIFQLASGGFSSTVRLAKSSPDMWAPIFRQNRDHLLDVLDEHINQLARFRSLLIKNDFEGMHRLMREANLIKKIIS